jgi:hypothetical protein
MLHVVVHICNPSVWEAEAVGSQVQCQPRLHSETLFQKERLSSNPSATGKKKKPLQIVF